jgi:hypothetical protein
MTAAGDGQFRLPISTPLPLFRALSAEKEELIGNPL